MNSGIIGADGTGGDIEGSTRGPRGPKNEALRRLIHHTEQHVFRVNLVIFREEEHGTTFPPLPFWLCFSIFRGFASLFWVVVWMFYSPSPNFETTEWTVKTNSLTMMTSTLATSTMVTGADWFMAELVLIGLILSLGVFSVSDGPTNKRTDKIFLGSSRIRQSWRGKQQSANFVTRWWPRWLRRSVWSGWESTWWEEF